MTKEPAGSSSDLVPARSDPGRAGRVRFTPWVLAKAIAPAVDETEGVARRHGGALGHIATYGGDEPVLGVTIATWSSSGPTVPPPADLQIKVDVVVEMGRVIPEVAEQLRDRVGAAIETATGDPAGRKAHIDIHVHDLADSPDVVSNEVKRKVV